MGQAPTARLTNELARQVCQRTQSAAVLDGSIAQIGSTYNLVLNAVNCASGETLATATTEAPNKDQVLGALGKVAEEIRGKLGESLASIQKYNTPIAEATTSSLEALKAYSLGIQARGSKGEEAAAPFLKQAVTLDPNFAMAMAVLGQVETNLGAVSLGREYTKKAYDLRDRASELEKFYIEIALLRERDWRSPASRSGLSTLGTNLSARLDSGRQPFRLIRFTGRVGEGVARGSGRSSVEP